MAGGTELDEVCRHLEIAESTWRRWVAQYGGMKVHDANRLKELEGENARLKRLLAEAELGKLMLREIAERNFWPRTANAALSRCCPRGSGRRNDERAPWSASTGQPNG